MKKKEQFSIIRLVALLMLVLVIFEIFQFLFFKGMLSGIQYGYGMEPLPLFISFIVGLATPLVAFYGLWNHKQYGGIVALLFLLHNTYVTLLPFFFSKLPLTSEIILYAICFTFYLIMLAILLLKNWKMLK